MNRCVIVIAGAVGDRIKGFAETLAETLPGKSVRRISLHDFLTERSLSVFRMSSYDLDELRKDVSDASDDSEFCVVYGEPALQIGFPKEMTLLSLYIDSDPLEIAMLEVEASLAEMRRLEERQTSQEQMSENVIDTSKEFNALLEEHIYPQKEMADIVIHHSETPADAVPGLVRYIVRIRQEGAGTHIDQQSREARIDELLSRYTNSRKAKRKYRRKRLFWRAVVKSTLFFKRFIDIVVTSVALLLLSPLFLIVAIIIKLTDGGSVFYFQTRVGKQGKEFQFPKFRSMVVDADKLKDQLLQQSERKGDVTFKMKHDPRVTRIGRFIRRFSIDELPQLWCVLKGDMSLVGPRPPLPREVALYTQEDRRRLEVTPGLTGIWQVSGRADIGFEDQVKLDVLYIESHSLWLDIKLLFKTIPAVLTGKGAY